MKINNRCVFCINGTTQIHLHREGSHVKEICRLCGVDYVSRQRQELLNWNTESLSIMHANFKNRSKLLWHLYLHRDQFSMNPLQALVLEFLSTYAEDKTLLDIKKDLLSKIDNEMSEVLFTWNPNYMMDITYYRSPIRKKWREFSSFLLGAKFKSTIIYHFDDFWSNTLEKFLFELVEENVNEKMQRGRFHRKYSKQLLQI